MTGHQTAMLNLFQDGRTEAVCDRFEIFDNARKLLFFADSNEVGLKLENLRILGECLSFIDVGQYSMVYAVRPIQV